jgi:hypothetical protein
MPKHLVPGSNLQNPKSKPKCVFFKDTESFDKDIAQAKIGGSASSSRSMVVSHVLYSNVNP